MSLTQRYLRATPMRVDTSATFDQMRQKLAATAPDVTSLKPGWGSYEDGDGILNLANFTPEAGVPVIWAGDAEVPESLTARLYYYRRNPTLRRQVPPGSPAGMYHTLQAVDVVISAIPDLEGSYTVLVASWNQDEIDLALKHLRLMVASIDDTPTWTADSSVLDLISQDFFHWLIYRALQKRKIGNDMELDKLRDVAGKDSLSHTYNLGDGIDASRGELLYLVSAPGVSFGPAIMVLAHDRIDLSVDFQLKLTGAFSITMRSTKVHEDHDADGKPIKLGEIQKRIRAFEQVAHVVIPELKEAYRTDKKWHDGYRDEFKDACRAETNRLTAAPAP